jgi:osmotically-inducible protein OsmY
MQRFCKHISALFLIVAFITSIGCASTPTEEGTGEFVDDSVITTKVKTAILREINLKVGEIKVTTFKGDVQLSGTVSSQDEIEIAIKVAQGIGGVKSVKSDLQVK